MVLEPTTSEQMVALIAELRKAGVLSYSYRGLVLTLHPEATLTEEISEPIEEKVSNILGLTKAQQDDMFNEVVDPVP